MSKKLKLSDFLLMRLHELGIKDIFGVPGDFNLEFPDHIVEHNNVKWIGTCNELNGSYAADGYARIKGAAAVVTTFGVGELSAINGIAGAYAEYVPVVKIVGIPSTMSQKDGALLHHTFADGNYTHFQQMYKHITVAQAVLNDLKTAPQEIDRVLAECWLKKRPVYIAIPCNLVHETVEVPTSPLNLTHKTSDADAVFEAAERIVKLIKNSKKIVAIFDICADRHKMHTSIEKFIQKTGIPFATMYMGRSILSESHPLFLGIYSGELSSSKALQEYVETSDCILSFGTLLSDLNTGGFTTNIKVNNSVNIHSNYVEVKNSTYHEVFFDDLIPQLLTQLAGYQFKGTFPSKKVNKLTLADNSTLTQDVFWQKIGDHLPPNSNIVSEIGTSYFGLSQFLLPEGAKFIGQPLWSSIGYSVGALLGVCIAEKNKRNYLFVGDGSFQLTAQEISTMLKHKLHPIIFLLNNNGYTVERLIHGEKMPYNDIQNWHYSQLPKVFGENCVSAEVKTVADLEKAFSLIEKNKDKLVFIELKFGIMDAPQSLIKLAKTMEKRNQ